MEEDDDGDLRAKNWAVTRPRESAEETDDEPPRTTTDDDDADDDEEEEEEEEEEETAPFSWEDIVRASVTTLEEVFSNEGDDDDDGREKEENEKKLTVGIVKGAGDRGRG